MMQAISTVTAHCLVKEGFVVMHLGKVEKLDLRKKLHVYRCIASGAVVSIFI